MARDAAGQCVGGPLLVSSMARQTLNTIFSLERRLGMCSLLEVAEQHGEWMNESVCVRGGELMSEGENEGVRERRKVQTILQ